MCVCTVGLEDLQYWSLPPMLFETVSCSLPMPGSFQELSPPPTIGALLFQVYATPPGFIVVSRDPNSGLHALLANTFIHGTISLALQCMLLVKSIVLFLFQVRKGMRVFVLILGGKDLFSCFVVLGLKPTASCMPGKLYPHP